MFTKESKSDGEVETVIGQSVQVEGNFTSQGNIIVEGGVTGTLKTSGNLRVGPNARVKADIEAKNIFTAGEIRGNQIIAQEKIELTKTAKINGNIKAGIISMESGAIINGKVSMSAETPEPEIQTELPNNKKDKRNNK